jgi:ankyrin repeat protein
MRNEKVSVNILALFLLHIFYSRAFFTETSPLHVAVESGNIQQLSDLLAGGKVDVNSLDALFQTPLHATACCARIRYLDAAALILKNGGDVDVEDEEGKTALHWAAMNGKIDLCNLLLQHDADINAKDNKGWTPLHFAAAEGHHSTASWLCEHGSTLNARTVSGSTPLFFAVDGDHIATVGVLIRAGADSNVVDYSGRTCRSIAQKDGDLEMLQALEVSEKS